MEKRRSHRRRIGHLIIAVGVGIDWAQRILDPLFNQGDMTEPSPMVHVANVEKLSRYRNASFAEPERLYTGT